MYPIANITSNDEFTKLCKMLFTEEYSDFQTINDGSGDRGNDGYSESEKILFQLHCPETLEKTDAKYKEKIKKDLDKAKKLVGAGEYVIETWIFVTPAELSENVQTYIRQEAFSRGFKGVAWASPKLTALLAKHKHLRSEFPRLILPDIEAKIDSSKDEILSHLTSVEEVEKKYKTNLEQGFSRKIDSARTILNSGQYSDAKKEYEIILRDLKDQAIEIDKHLFFRTYNNLGVAEENMGNQEKAAELYEKAYEAEPDFPMAISKFAMAKLMKNKPEEALEIVEKLLTDHPKDENAIATKANALQALGRYPELIKFLKDNEKVSWAIWYEGQEAMSKNDFKRATEAFEKVAVLEPENHRAYMYAAQNVLIGSREFLSENPLPLNKFPKDIKADYEKAIGWLKEAIRILKTKDVKIDLEMAYTNLANCLGSAGLYKEALESANEALLLDPTSQMALYNKAVSELKLNKFADSLATLKKFQSVGGDNPEVTKHIAYCALRTNDLDLSEKILEKELSDENPLDLGLAEVGVEFYSRKLYTDKLDKLLARIAKDFPNDPRAIRIKANYLQQIGSPEALDVYKLALEKSKSESELFFAEIDLADCLYDAKEYVKAGEIYERYVDAKSSNPANIKYSICLFESGQYGKLLKWIETLDPSIRKNSSIRQTEAYANWTLNNLKKAADIFKDLYANDSTSIGYLVYYGMCQFRLGNEVEAKRSYDAIKDRVTTASDLAALAGGYEFIGDRNLPIELTYKGLQNEPHNPKAHLAYIFSFFRREQTGEKEFDEKYVKAFQDSLANFNKKFPEEKALQGIEVKDNDISEILKIADQISEVTGNAQNLYQTSKAPLAFIPKFTGKKAFDVWAAFTNMPEVGIKIAFGTQDEMTADNSTVESYSGRSIVIDIYPLFLLGHLEKLDLLENNFDKIYVYQSTFDDLTSTIEDQRISAEKGITSFGKIDGKHRITEIPAEAVKKSLTLLEKIRDTIIKNDKFEIRGLSKEVDEENEPIIEALDDSTKGGVLLSRELSVPFYSDDRILRAILRNELDIKAFSTQSLMYLVQKNKQVGISDRYDFQRKLIDLNYDFVSMDGHFIHDQLKKESYKIEPLSRVISYLTKKDTSIQSLVVVLSDFIHLLFLDHTINSREKVDIIRAILKEAKKNFELSKIEEGVIDTLQKRLPPEKHQQLTDLIKLFFVGMDSI